MFLDRTNYRVLITCPQMQKTIECYRDGFQSAGIVIELPNVVQQLSEDELAQIIHRFDGMIAGDDPLTARVLGNARRLKIISKWGVGVDNIDREAAKALGIKVTNTPDVFGDEVADVTIGYLIMLARHLHKTDHGVRSGSWPKLQGRSLAGKTLGVIGLGSIGHAVALRALAMGMRVVGSDIEANRIERAQARGVEVLSVEGVFGQSDFLALCCPLTAATRHVLNKSTLLMVKQGVSIVNTARGGLIDEAALIKGLESGRIRAAALDVFEIEPLPSESPLRRFEQIILGAHNSSNTIEATLRVNELSISNLLAGLGLSQKEGALYTNV